VKPKGAKVKGQSQGERLSNGAKEAKGAKGLIDTWAVGDERRKEGFLVIRRDSLLALRVALAMGI